MSVERVNPHGMGRDQKVESFGDLALFLGGSSDSWTGLLLRLIGKSDPEHKAALRAAFPVHVAAHERWVTSGSDLTVGQLEEHLRR